MLSQFTWLTFSTRQYENSTGAELKSKVIKSTIIQFDFFFLKEFSYYFSRELFQKSLLLLLVVLSLFEKN